MKKHPFLLLLFLLINSAWSEANPINPFPYLSVKDYIRGTYGEPLDVANTHLAGRHVLRITDELRLCDYDEYWDDEGEQRNLDEYLYSRLVNFINMDYGVSDYLEIGARWYYFASDLEGVENRKDASNEGLGDFLVRVRVDPFHMRGKATAISFGASMKFPTGEYDARLYQSDTLPTGTGSRDLSLMAYGSQDLKFLELHASLGYVITGKAEYYGWNWNDDSFELRNSDLGNVFSYDLAVVRRFTPLISALVEFNGYAMGSEENEEEYKVKQTSRRLSIAPGIAVFIPQANLMIEGGFSHDLVGKQTLRGTSPLLRVKFTGQIFK